MAEANIWLPHSSYKALGPKPLPLRWADPILRCTSQKSSTTRNHTLTLEVDHLRAHGREALLRGRISPIFLGQIVC